MKIQLIATDLDGTFLNSSKRISDLNRYGVRACREQGIRFGIATGRPVDTTLLMAERWNLQADLDFIVAMNGGVIYNAHTGERNEFYLLKGYQVQEIIHAFQDMDVHFQVKIKTIRYTDYSTEKTQKDALRYGETEVKTNLDELLDRCDVNKLNVVCAPSYRPQVEERAHLFIETHKGITGFASQPGIFEFVNEKVNKGFGLQMIANDFKIPMENTLAFGDGGNDMKLIEAAGIGVVMKNGDVRLKQIADVVLEWTNDESGVGQYLMTQVLK